MNAYELAEKLHKAVNSDEKHLTLDIEAIFMLRQQAKEIENLETSLKNALLFIRKAQEK